MIVLTQRGGITDADGNPVRLRRAGDGALLQIRRGGVTHNTQAPLWRANFADLPDGAPLPEMELGHARTVNGRVDLSTWESTGETLPLLAYSRPGVAWGPSGGEYAENQPIIEGGAWHVQPGAERLTANWSFTTQTMANTTAVPAGETTPNGLPAVEVTDTDDPASNKAANFGSVNVLAGETISLSLWVKQISGSTSTMVRAFPNAGEANSVVVIDDGAISTFSGGPNAGFTLAEGVWTLVHARWTFTQDASVNCVVYHHASSGKPQTTRLYGPAIWTKTSYPALPVLGPEGATASVSPCVATIEPTPYASTGIGDTGMLLIECDILGGQAIYKIVNYSGAASLYYSKHNGGIYIFEGSGPAFGISGLNPSLLLPFAVRALTSNRSANRQVAANGASVEQPAVDGSINLFDRLNAGVAPRLGYRSGIENALLLVKQIYLGNYYPTSAEAEEWTL